MSEGKLENIHVINEIKDLQYDLQCWVRGEIEEDFDKISRRQATDLTVISSTGTYQSRTQFNERYQVYYGKHPDAELRSEIVRIKRLTSMMIMVVYKQYSKISGTEQQRLTTAIFRYKASKKNNAEWIHVHVTRLRMK